MELGFHAFGQVLDRLGLGQAGRPFHQQVAIGEQGDQQAVDELFLTENLGGQVLAQGDQCFAVFHRWTRSEWTGKRKPPGWRSTLIQSGATGLGGVPTR